MYFSKYNIFSKIKDSDNYFIVNLLSGNADILLPNEASVIENLQSGKLPQNGLLDELAAKGYWVDESSEKALFRNKYLDFIDMRDKDEVQLFFVPNYSCNFACSYCYQDEYQNPAEEMKTGFVDAFMAYVVNEFAGRRKYITVFGGEPLLNSPRQRQIIQYLLQKAKDADIDVCFVTNGYTLTEYVDILKEGHIREIQVTLDGTSATHNARRFLKGGAGTFDKVVAGIDACIENKLMVNLRMVIDKENIDNLPQLASFAIEKKWVTSPYFKTQIGRNYELHHCQSAPDKLFTRISLYEKLYELSRKYPYILDFYKPAYSVSKFLAENGNLPDPLFDSCPACKTEWAFDYTGKIYSCTATVGKASEVLGTFYPTVTRKQEIIDEWENRDVIAIEQCKDCSVQLACGGGCGSVAKNTNGKISSPDCRPVKELLELGFSAYLD
jgi:uncharacterized protein